MIEAICLPNVSKVLQEPNLAGCHRIVLVAVGDNDHVEPLIIAQFLGYVMCQ